MAQTSPPSPKRNDASSNDAAQQRSSRWIDVAALMRIKNLEFRAKAIVEGMFSGLHRSPYHGFSVEFSEYRQYTQGDDPRYIDWKLYARTDRHFIKRFEDETNLRCYLLVDRSHSMEYTSQEVTKSDYAITLAATMAYFLSRQRDAVGALTFADEVIGYIPARYRVGHFHRLLGELEKTADHRTTNIEAPLERMAQLTKKRGMVVLLSDLLVPLGEIGKRLGYLRSQGHDVLVLRVLDPSEKSLDLDSATMIKDLETGKQLYVDPAHARAVYQQRFSEHADQLKRTCQQLGVDFREMTTSDPIEEALFDFLNARNQIAAQAIQRSAGAQGGRG